MNRNGFQAVHHHHCRLLLHHNHNNNNRNSLSRTRILPVEVSHPHPIESSPPSKSAPLSPLRKRQHRIDQKVVTPSFLPARTTVHIGSSLSVCSSSIGSRRPGACCVCDWIWISSWAFAKDSFHEKGARVGLSWVELG
jgi:hypothetical protein